MTSLTVPHPPEAPGPTSVSQEGSGVSPVAPLDPFLYQCMRWCEQRNELQIFVAMWEGGGRRAGVCLGCGEYIEVEMRRTTEGA
jgi:hypothetical protein